MRKFHSNLAFVDLLFNLLVGFTSMFIIAFLLINPVAKVGKIDPPVELLITAKWDDDSGNDVDMWVKGPSGRAVGYTNKDEGYIVLNRDDLGFANEAVNVGGVKTRLRSNVEATEIRGIVPGRYVVNVHLYRVASDATLEDGTEYVSRGDEEVTLTLLDIKPYDEVAETKVKLVGSRAEMTAFVFEVDATGKVTSISTDGLVRIVPSAGYYDGGA